MKSFFNNPVWLDQFKQPYEKYEDIPAAVFDSINKDLDQLLSEDPLVSIVIAAWNEEVSILRTIASLAKSETSIPLEIIVINNNSTDHTQQTLDRLHVKNFFQPLQGWGPARQLGMEKARGKYILLADADCIYPAAWVQEMTKSLQTEGTACVYGRYSFMAMPGFSRWKLSLYERMRNIIATLRHFKRPHLNAYGMSMGYVKEYGLKAGFVMYKIRGEDGRLCFDLMKYGKVNQVKNNNARVWTLPRTLQQDGNLGQALSKRIRKEIKRLSSLFTVHPPHDTKTSEN